MLNQVSYTFIICYKKQYFVISYLKIFFSFGLKWLLIKSKQPSLNEIKALKHTDNSVVKIMLFLLVFIIPFSGCKNVCISYPKAYWLKKISFDSDCFIFKGELQLPLQLILRSSPKPHDWWLQAATLTIPQFQEVCQYRDTSSLVPPKNLMWY